MSDLTKIAVDAMGGDGSPKKIIDGIIHNHKSNKKNLEIKLKNLKKVRQKIVLLKQDTSKPDFGRT